MVSIAYLLAAMRCYQQGELGDAAAFKAAALGVKPYVEIQQQLDLLRNPIPRIDVQELNRFPEGSFGKALAEFLADNHLQPLTISATVAEQLRRKPCLAIRYTVLHDAFHVLLGFDTTLAGELGVWAFVSAQHYSPTYDRAARWGRWVYSLLQHWQWRRLRQCDRWGRTLGTQAKCVIAAPLETYWPLPLAEVRTMLGLTLGGADLS